MLLADLPYAHETAAGSAQVGFFNPDSAEDLKEKMLNVIKGNDDQLGAVPSPLLEHPIAHSWKELFDELLA